jgi:hypothetical protein
MRYEKRYESKSEKSNKEKKQIERQKRLEERNRNSSTNRWKQLSAKVISSPTNVCTIQRTTFIQEEVVIKCSILGASPASIYTVRFIHKRTLQFARELKAGDFICLEECRFSPVAGRSETEILVKRASRINAYHP